MNPKIQDYNCINACTKKPKSFVLYKSDLLSIFISSTSKISVAPPDEKNDRYIDKNKST